MTDSEALAQLAKRYRTLSSQYSALKTNVAQLQCLYGALAKRVHNLDGLNELPAVPLRTPRKK